MRTDKKHTLICTTQYFVHLRFVMPPCSKLLSITEFPNYRYIARATGTEQIISCKGHNIDYSEWHCTDLISIGHPASNVSWCFICLP